MQIATLILDHLSALDAAGPWGPPLGVLLGWAAVIASACTATANQTSEEAP